MKKSTEIDDIKESLVFALEELGGLAGSMQLATIATNAMNRMAENSGAETATNLQRAAKIGLPEIMDVQRNCYRRIKIVEDLLQSEVVNLIRLTKEAADDERV
ncbi:hypothetical protein [Jeotgalibaca arthritidis]|uniref:Uncharacterized protein n=1 Tax=Jeotgalibaca arthritidis TaxID=1868794 RepID=A0A6G7KBH8_9LACT|nr:hypothetical protein [Jeotgalibaca arthritidis]QII82619.1 hypothetical protein G7057_09365 [Jeotgalibaca arthritidis]